MFYFNFHFLCTLYVCVVSLTYYEIKYLLQYIWFHFFLNCSYQNINDNHIQDNTWHATMKICTQSICFSPRTIQYSFFYFYFFGWLVGCSGGCICDFRPVVFMSGCLAWVCMQFVGLCVTNMMLVLMQSWMERRSAKWWVQEWSRMLLFMEKRPWLVASIDQCVVVQIDQLVV